MKISRLSILPLVFVLSSCDSYEFHVCDSAVDGLPNSMQNRDSCENEALDARIRAVQNVAQKYRNMPR